MINFLTYASDKARATARKVFEENKLQFNSDFLITSLFEDHKQAKKRLDKKRQAILEYYFYMISYDTSLSKSIRLRVLEFLSKTSGKATTPLVKYYVKHGTILDYKRSGYKCGA